MAKGVGFEGANRVMKAPQGSTQEECYDLDVFMDGEQVISAWRLSPDEIETVKETGVVWVSIIGNGMPPIAISGEPLLFYGNRPSKVEPYIKKANRDGK